MESSFSIGTLVQGGSSHRVSSPRSRTCALHFNGSALRRLPSPECEKNHFSEGAALPSLTELVQRPSALPQETRWSSGSRSARQSPASERPLPVLVPRGFSGHNANASRPTSVDDGVHCVTLCWRLWIERFEHLDGFRLVDSLECEVFDPTPLVAQNHHGPFTLPSLRDAVRFIHDRDLASQASSFLDADDFSHHTDLINGCDIEEIRGGTSRRVELRGRDGLDLEQPGLVVDAGDDDRDRGRSIA